MLPLKNSSPKWDFCSAFLPLSLPSQALWCHPSSSAAQCENLGITLGSSFLLTLQFGRRFSDPDMPHLSRGHLPGPSPCHLWPGVSLHLPLLPNSPSPMQPPERYCQNRSHIRRPFLISPQFPSPSPDHDPHAQERLLSQALWTLLSHLLSLSPVPPLPHTHHLTIAHTFQDASRLGTWLWQSPLPANSPPPWNAQPWLGGSISQAGSNVLTVIHGPVSTQHHATYLTFHCLSYLP